MKRFLFFILLIGILPISGFSQDKKQVAILEPIVVTGNVSVMQLNMLRGEMVKSISNQSGYAAFTRTDIDQIMKEQNFQQSGMVDDSTRKRLGVMQGVDYVCVMKITSESNSFYLEASLVHVETGQISNPATQYGELQEGSSLNRIMLAACEKLAGELVGRKVQYTSSYSRPSYSYSSSPKLSSDEEFSSTTASSSGESFSSSSSVNHRTIPQGYVDLGLPSKTLWKDKNEGGNFHTYEEAVGRFGNKLPTKQQLEELKNRCIWTWTGNGYKVTGPNGNSITLPAAGYRYGFVQNVGMCGYYWSSTTQHPRSAWHLYFSSIETSINGHGNYDKGFSVRLVQN